MSPTTQPPMPPIAQLSPAARTCCVTLTCLALGCARDPRATPRSDSLALATSGGVSADSGAAPMRVAHAPERHVASEPEWGESVTIGQDAAPSVLPPPPEPPVIDTDDESVDDARHDAETLREEAAAAASAAAEAEAAALAAEARLETMLGRLDTRLHARGHHRRERAVRIRW